jgi:hypothetical protein
MVYALDTKSSIEIEALSLGHNNKLIEEVDIQRKGFLHLAD